MPGKKVVEEIDDEIPKDERGASTTSVSKIAPHDMLDTKNIRYRKKDVLSKNEAKRQKEREAKS